MKINFYVIYMLSLIFNTNNFVNAHTIDSICESLRNYQNDIIVKEKQHFIKQEHNEYIYFEYELLSKDAKQYIQRMFVRIINEYVDLKNSSAIGFDCLEYNYDYKCVDLSEKHYLNIIKFMHAKSELPDKNYKIYEKYKEYKYNASFYKEKKVNEVVQVFSQNVNEKNLIINNCLSTIEDYAIFLNEMEMQLAFAEDKNKFIILCFSFNDIEQKNEWNELFNNFNFIKNYSEQYYFEIIRSKQRFPSYHRSMQGIIEPIIGESYITDRKSNLLVRENYSYRYNTEEKEVNSCFRHSIYTYMICYDYKTNGNTLINEYNLDSNLKKHTINIRNQYGIHSFTLYSNVTKLTKSKGVQTQDGYLISLFIKCNLNCYCAELKRYQYTVDFDINKTLTPQEQQILNNKRENANNYVGIKHFINLIKTFFDVKLIYNEPKFLLGNISKQDSSDLRYLRYVKCNWIKTIFNPINLDAIIVYICSDIFSQFKNLVKFYLFEYELNDQETFYEYDRVGFMYFKNILNVNIIQEINCSLPIEISPRRNMFIQINFEEEGNRQNYYLFLPTLSLKPHKFTSFFKENRFFNIKDLTALMQKPKDRLSKNDNAFLTNITKESITELNINDVFLLCNNQNLKDSKLESIIFRNILSSDDFTNQSAEILSLITIEDVNNIKKEFKLKKILRFNTPFYYLYHELLKINNFSEFFQEIMILIKEYCVEYGKKYEDYYDKNHNAYFLLAMGSQYFLDNRYDDIVFTTGQYFLEFHKKNNVIRP